MAVIDQDKVVRNLEDWLDLGEYQIKTHEEKTKKIRIVFMGTPSFAVPILEGLIENYEVVLVVCQPDKKKDRKGKIVIPDTKRVALEHHVEVFQPVRLRDDYQKILD